MHEVEAAVLRDPDDWTARLAYADLLEELGDASAAAVQREAACSRAGLTVRAAGSALYLEAVLRRGDAAVFCMFQWGQDFGYPLTCAVHRVASSGHPCRFLDGRPCYSEVLSDPGDLSALMAALKDGGSDRLLKEMGRHL